jgi:hypothetical protein
MQARWTTWLRCARLVLLTGFLLVAPCSTPFAAAKPKKPEVAAGPEEKSYVNQYALVLLCIALGMVLICKPSGRLPRVKMPDE